MQEIHDDGFHEVTSEGDGKMWLCSVYIKSIAYSPLPIQYQRMKEIKLRTKVLNWGNKKKDMLS